MGKVIKVIDLLNMIANGEKLPKKIKYECIEWERTGDYKNYCHFNEEDCITEHIIDYIGMSSLSEEVEILDEEQEIDIQQIPKNVNPESWRVTDSNFIMCIEIENQLVDAVKLLDLRLKKLESNT